jgi:hypothetical protein
LEGWERATWFTFVVVEGKALRGVVALHITTRHCFAGQNTASQRVLRANGFTVTAALDIEKQGRDGFSYPSTIVYRLMREDAAKRGTAMTLQALLDGYSQGLPDAGDCA